MASEDCRKSFGYADVSSPVERDAQQNTMTDAIKTLYDSGYASNDTYGDYNFGADSDADILF